MINQEITYFTDSKCSQGKVDSYILTPNAGTHNFSKGSSGNSYFYQISTTDHAGNITTSACSSSSMLIDRDFPNTASRITW